MQQQQPFKNPAPTQGPFSSQPPQQTNQPMGNACPQTHEAPANMPSSPQQQFRGNGHQTPNHAPNQHHQSMPQDSQFDPSEIVEIAVYGSKFALEAKTSATKRHNWKTMKFEAAPRANPNNPQDRTYSWKHNKIALQFTFDELPLLVAVMFGFAPSVLLKNHGAQNDKGVSIEFQNDKFFISLFQAGKSAYGVPVPLISAMNIGNLALTQYAANFEGLDTATALQNINRYTDLLRRADKFPLVKK